MAKSQKVFQFDSNLQKKVQKHDPEHYLREEKMLMIMIWYLDLKNSEIKSPLRISASFEMKAKQSKQKLDPFTPTCVIFVSGGKRIGLVYKG